MAPEPVGADEMLRTLIAVTPGFAERWAEVLSDWSDEDPPFPGHYIAMQELAGFVVDEFAAGRTEFLPRFFAVVEELFNSGDSEVDNILGAGLIEDLQGIASHSAFGSNAFLPFLGPTSVRTWHEIESGLEMAARSTVASSTPPPDPDEIEDPTLKRVFQAMYRRRKPDQ